MQFITENNQHQTNFTTANEQVSSYNEVRLIDAFTDKLDLQKAGCTQQGVSQQTIIEIPRKCFSNRDLFGGETPFILKSPTF